MAPRESMTGFLSARDLLQWSADPFTTSPGAAITEGVKKMGGETARIGPQAAIEPTLNQHYNSCHRRPANYGACDGAYGPKVLKAGIGSCLPPPW